MVTRANRTTSADQAKNNLSDGDIMQQIRKPVMADKSLSTYAHNVKIISQHGQVTLKGPVRSDEEKRTIGEKATEVAGSGNVNNQITIKPARKIRRGEGESYWQERIRQFPESIA